MPNMSKFDLQKATHEVILVMQMANTREVEIVLKFYKDSKEMICTDMQRFQQVLLNMLQNATKNAQLNSSVVVSLYTRPLSES